MTKLRVNILIAVSITLIALSLRLACVFVLSGGMVTPDAITDYDPIAVNLLEGKGFVREENVPDYIRGPGYPMFLAGVYYLFGRDFTAVRIVQAVMDSLTVVCIMFLAYFVFKRWDRVLAAGAIAASYPLLIYSSNLVACETLFLFLFMVSLILFIVGLRKQQVILFSLSGFFLAVSALTRSTTILFPIVTIVWLFCMRIFNKKVIIGFVFFALTFFITIAPWTIRNYNVFNEFIPTVCNGGNNFCAGSAPEYLTTNQKRREAIAVDKKRYIEKGLIKERTSDLPLEVDGQLMQIGFQNYKKLWRENPLKVIAFPFYKAIRLWYATDSGRFEGGLFVMQLPFLIFSLFSLCLGLKHKIFSKVIWLVLFSFFYFWGLFAVMLPLARYSLPLIPFLAIFIAGYTRKESDQGCLND